MSPETIFFIKAMLICYIPISYVFMVGIVMGGRSRLSMGYVLMLAFSPLSAPFMVGFWFSYGGKN